MSVTVLAEQAVVLCQVEKAKEDMLNQLYRSIRLATYQSLWWHTDDTVSHVWMHNIFSQFCYESVLTFNSIYFWCLFLYMWRFIQNFTGREKFLVVIKILICASFHVFKCISGWMCPWDIIRYYTLQLKYEHLQL